MVDQIVTKQELINAHADVQALEDIVNDAPETQVQTRLGRYVWTLSTIEQRSLAKINEWQNAINTIVINDGVPALAVSNANGKTQQEINDFGGAEWYAKTGGYELGATVKLSNGDVVKSTVSNNAVNPNIDMTGWENPLAIQQVFNDKFSKWKQLEAGAVERDLSVREKDVQFAEDYATIQDAFNAKRFSTTALELGFGTKTLTAPLSLTSNHQIKGKGEMSLIACPAGTGIVYTAGAGLFDDHTHKSLRDFRVLGDGTVQDYLTAKNGTTIGYQQTNTGHMGETHGMTFDRHGTGLKIEKSYTNRNTYNYYRANKIGLHLKDTTSHREESIYARFNSEAAILIEGQIQNITFAGGAVEGNRGRGLWVKNLAPGLYAHILLDDVYFEACGDRSAGIPSIDVQHEDKFHIDVRGGSYWNNVNQGITSGIYKWGNSVSFVSSTLNSSHYAKKMRIKDTIDYAGFNTDAVLAAAQANGLTEPTMMLEYSPTFRVDGLGPVFQVQLAGRPTRKMLTVNEITATYPHVLSRSASTELTENTTLDYGDGSWTDIAFSASGDYNNNYAQLTNLTDAASEYMSKVFVFLLKPATDCQVGIFATGGAAVNQAYFQLKAGVTYRMCCLANRSASGDYRMRMFSTNGAATLSYLPIYLAKFKTSQEGISFANMFCTGAL